MPDFVFETSRTFSVDTGKRTITGLTVPYGEVAKSQGKNWSFSKGTITWSDTTRIPLLHTHQGHKPIGVATDFEDTDQGLVGTFRIARGASGDEALAMAEDGVMTGLSVGIGPSGTYEEKDGVLHATNAPLHEVSLCALPAFDTARVTTVAASADKEGTTMEDETTAVETQAGPDFSAITDAIAAGFTALQVTGPEVVHAGHPLEVNEAPAYRFDGVTGQHDFSTDLIAGIKGDTEAYQRVLAFTQEQFAPVFNVATTNVVEANPPQVRPDMYVDERRYSTPFFSALRKGTLSDITPFVFPKLNTYSGLVADHVEGVEPTPGSFDLTSQTVTPSAVSGKVVINREVWDQGGNPQVSRLIWDKMTYSYFQMLEVKAVAVLDAATPTAIPLATGLSDDDLVNALEDAIAGLNFVAGGNVFNFAGTHIDLYKKLAAAVDSTGRKLLPIINPMNSNGRATAGFRALDVAGTAFVPAWSLGASTTGSESSYLVDTSCVHVWNTPPTQLTMDAIKVATVELGIWGYVATAISDLTGVREITYDATT